MTPLTSYDTETRDDGLVIRFPYYLHDTEAAQAVTKELARLVVRSGSDKLVLDFGGVQYLTAAALDGLVSLKKKLRANGVQLTLSGIDPLLHEVFEMTWLTRVFDIRRV
jgi:anti-sigma B factor antagonist